MVWPISVTTLADWSAAAELPAIAGKPERPGDVCSLRSLSRDELGIDMSKPSLQLIHCSSGIRPGARRARNGRSFRPLVIDGGVKSAPRQHCWETALELFNLGLQVCHGGYLAFLEASMIILNNLNWTGPERLGRSA